MEQSTKFKRYNIVELRDNEPKKFGRFIMALKNLINSDDWARICGIHGDSFKPGDKQVKCPTDPAEVTKIGETGEPFYCKHSVYSFIAWHAPYIYQFELLLNKYNKSKNKKYITLPWLDLTDFHCDYSFLNDPEITVYYDSRFITTENPLSCAYYYVDGVRTRTTRFGFLTPTNAKQYIQLKTVGKQLKETLHASNYEEFSSAANLEVSYTPLETPHNSVHNIIGGNNGNMSSINIAAFDPLFWLHHCNMDRYYYSWYSNITNQFTEPLFPKYIKQETLDEPCAPFFKHDVYSSDWNHYEYGWQNCTNSYAKVGDILDIYKFPYTYDVVKPLEEPLRANKKSYVSLTNIQIPQESVEINVYMHLVGTELNKNKDFAGSAFWFGVNQREVSCMRCKKSLTNINIDISDFVDENKINQSNLSNYYVFIEAHGMLIRKLDSFLFNIYTEEELVKSGKVNIVVPPQ